jgi:hypothetical protein
MLHQHTLGKIAIVSICAVALFGSTLALTTPPLYAAELSNDDGSSLFVATLNKRYIKSVLWIGTFSYDLQNNGDWSKGIIGSQYHTQLEPLQRAGLLTVVDKPPPQNWVGIILGPGSVTISPTQLTSPYLHKVDQHGDVIEIPPPKFAVTEVIKNEKLESATSELCLIMGVLTIDSSAAYRAWIESGMESKSTPGLPDKNKFMTLFAFDPFNKTWKLSAYDIAQQGSEFASTNTNDALRALGAVKAKPE